MTTEARHFIYGLVDPRTDEVRYVGKSTEPENRLKVHACLAKKGTKTHQYNWLRSVLGQGLRPKLLILEACTDDWPDQERKWIASLRQKGHPLTNMAEGGNGGWPVPLETRRTNGQKAGLARKGSKLTAEHIAKRTAKLKGRSNPSAVELCRELGKRPRTEAQLAALKKGREKAWKDRKGRKRPVEVRNKIRQGHLRRRASC